MSLWEGGVVIMEKGSMSCIGKDPLPFKGKKLHPEKREVSPVINHGGVRRRRDQEK